MTARPLFVVVPTGVYRAPDRVRGTAAGVGSVNAQFQPSISKTEK